MDRAEVGMVIGAQEAAELLGMHVETLYRHVDQGHVPGFKLAGRWKFRRDQLEEFTQKQARKGVTVQGRATR